MSERLRAILDKLIAEVDACSNGMRNREYPSAYQAKQLLEDENRCVNCRWHQGRVITACAKHACPKCGNTLWQNHQ